MKKLIVLIVVVAVVWFAYSSIQEQEVSAETVKIGFIGPLTGDVAFVGENMKAAVEIAIEEVNATGGLDGQLIEVIYEDGQCDGTAAANAANKLVNVDKVVAIIGGVCSGETLAVAPITEAAKVILLSAGSTAPSVTNAGDYVYRVIPSDSFQGTFAASLVGTTYNKKKVAILSCLGDYCVGIKDSFSEQFKKLGGEIVAEESFEQGAQDLRTQITKAQGAGPDAVYFIGYTGETIAGIRQMNELGLADKLIVGADAWSDITIWGDVGELGEGFLYTEPANKDYPQEFVDSMKAKTGADGILIHAGRAYDAAKILAEKFSKSPEETKAALDSLTDYTGISDTYTFDENGDMTNAIYRVNIIQNGVPNQVN